MGFLNIDSMSALSSGSQTAFSQKTSTETQIFQSKKTDLCRGVTLERTSQEQKPEKPNVAKLPENMKAELQKFEDSFNIDFFVTQMTAPKMEKLKDGSIRSQYLDVNGNVIKEEIISPDRGSMKCTYFSENGQKRGFYEVKSVYDEETNQYYWMPPHFINYEKGFATN